MDCRRFTQETWTYICICYWASLSGKFLDKAVWVRQCQESNPGRAFWLHTPPLALSHAPSLPPWELLFIHLFIFWWWDLMISRLASIHCVAEAPAFWGGGRQVLVCSLSWPSIPYVAEVGLWTCDLSSWASWVVRLQVYTTLPGYYLTCKCVLCASFLSVHPPKFCS